MVEKYSLPLPNGKAYFGECKNRFFGYKKKKIMPTDNETLIRDAITKNFYPHRTVPISKATTRPIVPTAKPIRADGKAIKVSANAFSPFPEMGERVLAAAQETRNRFPLPVRVYSTLFCCADSFIHSLLFMGNGGSAPFPDGGSKMVPFLPPHWGGAHQISAEKLPCFSNGSKLIQFYVSSFFLSPYLFAADSIRPCLCSR